MKHAKYYLLIIFLSCYLMGLGNGGLFNSNTLITVKGKIVNEKNEPVQAVITVKGTKQITNTHEKGEFLLNNVAENAILRISGVSIETVEIAVDGRSDVGEILVRTKITEGDEVLVHTGYEVKKPNEINGAVSLIDGKLLNQQVGSGILKRLDGVTTGVLFNTGKTNTNPQNTTNISVRGLSTIKGPLDPLIVVDGFIYEGKIENINPNTIESISILKDAAAASIWGARAGNGVIVINTKKGKFNRKTSIQLHSNYIVQNKPDLFYLPQMTSSDYIDVEAFLFGKGYFNSRINTGYQALTPAVEVFLRRRQGFISQADSAVLIDELKGIDSRYDYDKYIYRQSVTQQNSININGGSQSHSYLLSLAYDRNTGTLNDRYNKVNVNLANSFKLNQRLQLNMTVYYTNSQSLSGKQGFGTLRPGDRYLNYFRLADENGTPLSVATLYRDTYTDTAGAGKLLDWKNYPLKEFDLVKSTTKINELFATAGIHYKVTNHLNLDIRYQYQQQTTDMESLADKESFAVRNTINLFSQLNRSTGTVKYIVPPGGIRTSNRSITASGTLRGQFNFHKKWRIPELSAMVGAEIRQTKERGDGNTLYGYTADPLTYSDVDLVNTYPTFITGSYQSIGSNGTLKNTNYRFASFYGNFSYSLYGRYSLYGSARKEGSNIFGVSTNDKWKPLWSLGAGWKLSDENFFNLKQVKTLKLRFSYGYSGNVDLTRTALPIARYFPGTSPTNFPYGRVISLNNPNLRWEQSFQTNMGVDFAWKNNILLGSVDYYRKKGSDLYGETAYDYTTWGANNVITKNVANMSGNGWELNLSGKIIDRRTKWATNLLFNYAESRTTKYLSAAAGSMASLLGGGNSIIPVVGKPMYGIVAYRWGGLDNQGNPQGYVNGELSSDYSAIANEGIVKGLEGNIVYKGSGSPLIFGSLINQFGFSRFTLAVNISYRFKYFFRKSSIRYDALIHSGAGHKDYANRWQKAGDELITTVPSFVYPNPSLRDDFYLLSEVNILKGDHIRLQYINLSYALPKFLTKSIFSDGEVYANVSNVGILWRANKEKLDPDYPSSIRPTTAWALGISLTL
ncbi:MAG: SusC/RagA family TonB-linked outer membrane protein [Chitinophagaceae bacterium]